MKRSSIRSIWRVQSAAGATTVEHGLMIALIAAICIALITSLSSHLSRLFDTASKNVKNAGAASH
jgi:Flp pilus assembly pilin Flp